MTRSGQGIYNGRLESVAPGKYRFEAVALSYGDTLGRTSGEFTIEEYSLEMTSSSPDYNLTGRIAEVTGGKAYTRENFSGFAENLVLEPHVETRLSLIRPFGTTSILIIILAGLCIEWGLRKRFRLP